MTDVITVVGAGSIGQAIARRVSAGKKLLLADLRQANAEAVRWGGRGARINSVSPAIVSAVFLFGELAPAAPNR